LWKTPPVRRPTIIITIISTIIRTSTIDASLGAGLLTSAELQTEGLNLFMDDDL
jgi:hypothetical protein